MPTQYIVPSDIELVEDSEPERGTPALHRSPSPPSPHRRRTILNSPPCATSSRNSSSTQDTAFAPISRTPSPENLPTKLNFSDFAFQSTKAPLRRRVSTLATTTSTDKQRKPPPKKNKSTLALQFSDAEMALVNTCIACEAVWTVRKTAVQKFLHIRSCGKKKSYNDETIQILLRKKIDSSAGSFVPPKKLPTTMPSSGTHFEDALLESLKGRKRKHPSHTIKDPSSANADIRQKASHLIRAKSTTRDPSVEPTLPPSTQAFGASSLAQRQGEPGGRLLSNSAKESSDDEQTNDDPATQPFGSSRLAACHGDRPLLNDRNDECGGPSSLVQCQSPCTSLRTKLTYDSPSANAMLSFPKNIKDSSKDNVYIPDPQTSTKGASRVAKDGKAYTEEELWEDSIKSLVFSNEDLHLSILRFEPIPFDTFLKLIGVGNPSLKARMTLRNILDRNAIQFYGSETRR